MERLSYLSKVKKALSDVLDVFQTVKTVRMLVSAASRQNHGSLLYCNATQ